MTRYNALLAAASIVVAAVVWYPSLIAPAAAVAALVALCALALGMPRTPRTIIRLPTEYERQHARWLPGAGFGFSLRHWPPRPFLFITAIRWRR